MTSVTWCQCQRLTANASAAAAASSGAAHHRQDATMASDITPCSRSRQTLPSREAALPGVMPVIDPSARAIRSCTAGSSTWASPAGGGHGAHHPLVHRLAHPPVEGAARDLLHRRQQPLQQEQPADDRQRPPGLPAVRQPIDQRPAGHRQRRHQQAGHQRGRDDRDRQRGRDPKVQPEQRHPRGPRTFR
jgi:hypothetical protein